MPQSLSRTPKYRHYRPKNLAVVRIAGRDRYLGKYGSPESYERYDRLVAEWLVSRHQPQSGKSTSGDPAAPVTVMRTIDINTQGAIWEFRPHTHKGQHHHKERVVYLGPHAQEVIKPWLKTDLHAYVFSPRHH